MKTWQTFFFHQVGRMKVSGALGLVEFVANREIYNFRSLPRSGFWKGDQTGTKLGPNWNQTGTKLGSNWDQIGTELGLNWDQTGTKLGPNWDQSGIKLGTKMRPKLYQTGTQVWSGTGPAPGSQKVPKVSNSRQKQARGQPSWHQATPDFGTP